MAEEMGEKTEMPTPRRLSEAAQRGQTGKSVDIASAISLLGACVMVYWFAPGIFEFGAGEIRRHLGPEALGSSLRLQDVKGDLAASAVASIKVLVPLMLFMALLAYASQVWQVGFMLSSKALEPKLERLNIVAGLGKLVSMRAFIKGAIDVSKLLIIAVVAGLVISSEIDAIVSLAALDMAGGVMESVRITVRVAFWVLLVLLILGVIDRVYQSWQLHEDLKMTKQEVKDELRSQEGDMQVKGQRLKFMRGLMNQRLQSDVPKADVVVTNPTHFSVAIAYDAKTMKAPKVVAKGADYVALRIRYIATAHGVPIVERPPLARALYNHVEIGREVNPEHYEAIAEVLAYVYRLEGRAAG
ncbi:MAG: flagellar biosynthesis protein FlhB [Phycisphaerales bacterium]